MDARFHCTPAAANIRDYGSGACIPFAAHYGVLVVLGSRIWRRGIVSGRHLGSWQRAHYVVTPLSRSQRARWACTHACICILYPHSSWLRLTLAAARVSSQGGVSLNTPWQLSGLSSTRHLNSAYDRITLWYDKEHQRLSRVYVYMCTRTLSLGELSDAAHYALKTQTPSDSRNAIYYPRDNENTLSVCSCAHATDFRLP